MSFEDRVAAVEIATKFQEQSKEVIKLVEDDMDEAKTQVLLVKEKTLRQTYNFDFLLWKSWNKNWFLKVIFFPVKVLTILEN